MLAGLRRCCALILLTTLNAMAVDSLPVGQLLQAVKVPPGSERQVTELRVTPQFSKPVEVAGSVRLTHDGTLIRHITAPQEERIEIDGDSVTLVRKGRSRTVSVASNPALGQFYSALRALLSGDQTAVFEMFNVRREDPSASEDGEWQLTLEPKSQKLQRILQRMEVRGTDSVLEQIVIQQPGGRSQTMFFGDVIVPSNDAGEQLLVP